MVTTWAAAGGSYLSSSFSAAAAEGIAVATIAADNPGREAPSTEPRGHIFGDKNFYGDIMWFPGH